jgi:hypothetical protein
MGWGSFIGGMLVQGFIDKFAIEKERQEAVEEYKEKQDIITLKAEVERLKNLLEYRR